MFRQLFGQKFFYLVSAFLFILGLAWWIYVCTMAVAPLGITYTRNRLFFPASFYLESEASVTERDYFDLSITNNTKRTNERIVIEFEQHASTTMEVDGRRMRVFLKEHQLVDSLPPGVTVHVRVFDAQRIMRKYGFGPTFAISHSMGTNYVNDFFPTMNRLAS